MSDDEINEIPPERVLDRESSQSLALPVLRAKLKEALQDMDEARRERDEARRDLSRVRKELVSANRGAERNAHINNSLCSKLIQAERERGDALKGEV